GSVSVQEVTADGVVVLRFGGGCHGCGMADMTLKNGIEKTLLEKVPGVTAVRDATDHDTGAAPYISRTGAARPRPRVVDDLSRRTDPSAAAAPAGAGATPAPASGRVPARVAAMVRRHARTARPADRRG